MKTGSNRQMNLKICSALETIMKEEQVIPSDDRLRHLLTIAVAGPEGEDGKMILTLWNDSATIERRVGILAYLAERLINEGYTTREQLMTELMLRINSPTND